MKADKLLYVLLGRKLCTSMLDDVLLNHYAHIYKKIKRQSTLLCQNDLGKAESRLNAVHNDDEKAGMLATSLEHQDIFQEGSGENTLK